MASIRVIFKRLVLCAAGCVGIAYVTDYLYLRFRMLHPKPSDPYESITALRILAIPRAIFAGSDWGGRAACVAAALCRPRLGQQLPHSGR